MLCGRLSRPDAVDLLPERGERRLSQLAREANVLRERIREAEGLVESGVLSAAEFRQRRARLVERLGVVQGKRMRRLAAAVAEVASRRDVAEVWAGLDLGWRDLGTRWRSILRPTVPRPQGRAAVQPGDGEDRVEDQLRPGVVVFVCTDRGRRHGAVRRLHDQR